MRPIGVLVSVAALVVELALTAYLTFLGYFLTVWFVDDSLAAEWSSGDWYREGLTRFAMGLSVAIVFGLLAYFVNGHAMRRANRRWPRLRIVLAASLTAIITVAVLAGSLEFVTTKPYM